MKPIKLMFAMGTRPEAIKLAPTVLAAYKRKPIFHTTVISTACKNGLIDDVLDNFGVTPDIQPAVKNPGIYLDYGTSEMIQKTAKFS